MVGQTWLCIQTNSSGTLLAELMASNFSARIWVVGDNDHPVGDNDLPLGRRQRDISKL